MKTSLLKKRIRGVEVELRTVREGVSDDTPSAERRRLVYEAKAQLDQLWAELFDAPSGDHEPPGIAKVMG